MLEVLGIIRRFSEDLDLLVIGNYASASSQKRALKRLLAAAAVPTGLEPDGVSSGGNAGSFHRYGYLNPPLTDRALVAEFLTSAQQVSAGFSKPDLPVPAGGFAASPAFTRGSEFGERLRVEHDAAMRDLYYGTDTPPTFDDVLDQVHTDATLLSV
ncbi:MAG TPA: hypothetical protein VL068_08935 [Microthrixaceae bacterium]|nr:hypothetical protein [Microthrixaceae bacterium]